MCWFNHQPEKIELQMIGVIPDIEATCWPAIHPLVFLADIIPWRIHVS